MKRAGLWVVAGWVMAVMLAVGSLGAKASQEAAMVQNVLGKMVEKPMYGGVLNMPAADPATGFDEAFGPPYTLGTVQHTNEMLIKADWLKGPAGTGESEFGVSGFVLEHQTGCLAESWEIPDPGTIVFRVRKGVHFHDKPPTNGREMTADDVVFSLKRLWDLPTYFRTNAPDGIESITAPDKWTVVIKCPPKQQGPLFMLGAALASIVPREVVEKYGDMKDWKNACGTGAFMLTDYQPGSSITFKKHPRYWMRDPVLPENTLPYLDGIKMLIIPDQSTRLAAFRTGKLDWMGNVTWEETQNLQVSNPALKENLKDKWSSDQNLVYLIYLRTDAPPLNDIRVRRALALAIDNQTIKDKYYGGHAEILSWPVAPWKEFGDIYVPLEELPESARELYEYHPEKAKQLLAEAGYPNGFKTDVVCYTTHVDVLSMIKASWAKIGVDLEIDIKELGVWYGYIRSKAYKQMYYCYTGVATPLRMLETTVGKTHNLSIVDDKKCNETYDAILANFFDAPKKSKLYRDLVPYILDQAWVVQPPAPRSSNVWYGWLKGYQGEFSPGFHQHTGWPMYVWLDQGLRERLTAAR